MANTTSGLSGSPVARNTFPSAGAILNKVIKSYEVRPHKSKSQLKALFNTTSVTEYEQIKRTVEEGSVPNERNPNAARPATPAGKTIQHGSYSSMFSVIDDTFEISQMQAKQLGAGMDTVIDQGRDLFDNQFEAEMDRRFIRHLLGTYRFQPMVSNDSKASENRPLPLTSYLLAPRIQIAAGASARSTAATVPVPDHQIFQYIYAFLKQQNGDSTGSMLGVRQDLAASKYVCIVTNAGWTDIFSYNQARYSNRDWFGQNYITRDWGTMKHIGEIPIVQVTDDVLPQVGGTDTQVAASANNKPGNLVGLAAGSGASRTTVVQRGIAGLGCGYLSSYIYSPVNSDGRGSTGVTVTSPTMLTPSWDRRAISAHAHTQYNIRHALQPSAAGVGQTPPALAAEGMHRALFVPTSLFKTYTPVQFNRGWKSWDSQAESGLPTLYKEQGLESIRCFEDRIFLLHWLPSGLLSTATETPIRTQP